MIRMDADKQGMKSLQHRAQVRRDPLRQKDRDARADADEFHVRNGAKLRQQMFELLIAEEQRIAPAQQHIADRWSPADIFELPIEVRMEIVARRIAHQPRSCAVTAITGAP